LLAVRSRSRARAVRRRRDRVGPALSLLTPPRPKRAAGTRFSAHEKRALRGSPHDDGGGWGRPDAGRASVEALGGVIAGGESGAAAAWNRCGIVLVSTLSRRSEVGPTRRARAGSVSVSARCTRFLGPNPVVRRRAVERRGRVCLVGRTFSSTDTGGTLRFLQAGNQNRLNIAEIRAACGLPDHGACVSMSDVRSINGRKGRRDAVACAP
jgi:hypothetical protein